MISIIFYSIFVTKISFELKKDPPKTDPGKNHANTPCL
jgi:hypothetical protein